MSAIDYDEESRKRLNWLDITGGGAKDSLTVLDAFAIEALGFLTCVGYTVNFSHEERAVWAYDQAEAMLKERNKRFTPQGTVKGVTGKTYG